LKEVFSLPELYFKKNNQIDTLRLDEIEESMILSFKELLIKLNEDQLGPMIV